LKKKKNFFALLGYLDGGGGPDDVTTDNPAHEYRKSKRLNVLQSYQTNFTHLSYFFKKFDKAF